MNEKVCFFFIRACVAQNIFFFLKTVSLLLASGFLRLNENNSQQTHNKRRGQCKRICAIVKRVFGLAEHCRQFIVDAHHRCPIDLDVRRVFGQVQRERIVWLATKHLRQVKQRGANPPVASVFPQHFRRAGQRLDASLSTQTKHHAQNQSDFVTTYTAIDGHLCT